MGRRRQPRWQPEAEPNTQRQEQALARRNHILETALDLFARQGYHGTSTKQIAEAAGVTEGLIFYYFSGKSALLSAVLESRHSFRGEFVTLLAQSQGQPAALLLEQLARGWLATLWRESALTTLLLAEAQTHPQVGMALRGAIAEGVGRLAAYLRGRVEAGELRQDLYLETAAHMFFSSIFIFFMAHRQLAREQWEQRADAFVAELLATWLQAARG